MNRLAYIIILNWNNYKDTIECVQSCRKLTYPNFRILIVDNGSTDGSEPILRERFPELEILQTGANLGFAGGNNFGINYALGQSADFIWLLNNDTTVEPDALTEMVKVLDSDDLVGMVGSKILYYSEPDMISFAGGRVNWRSAVTEHIGDREKDVGQYDRLAEIDYATGCSLLIKSRVIKEIGLMHEDYFLYFEETDWCARVRKKYKILFVPSAKVYHKISASIGNSSSMILYYMTRNGLYFLERNGRSPCWICRMWEDFKNILRIFKHNQDNKLHRIKAILKAYYHWITRVAGPLHNLTKVESQKRST